MKKRKVCKYGAVQEYLDDLHKILKQGIASSFVFDEMMNLKAPNIVGDKKAKYNAETINCHSGFFTTAFEATRDDGIMKLAVILDDHRDSLHLNFLVELTVVFWENNKTCFDKARLNSLGISENAARDFVKKFKGMNKEKIANLKIKVGELDDIRKKVRKYRNSILGHNDKVKERVGLKFEEVQRAYEIILSIINMMSGEALNSSTTYSLVEDQCRRDTGAIVDIVGESFKH